MTMIDDRGRLFGRFNLIDSLVVLLVLIAIPMAYGTYLLFRPGTPRIDSVSPSNITKEEQRVTNAARLVAKFKIKGTGFTPLLRARIGDADALGFVFENPNSADVLVGPIPAGPQDLILMDGVQEVARALGLTIRVVPGDGAQPVGRRIGPALEAKDVLAVLNNDRRAPMDLRDRSLRLSVYSTAARLANPDRFATPCTPPPRPASSTTDRARAWPPS